MVASDTETMEPKSYTFDADQSSVLYAALDAHRFTTFADRLKTDAAAARYLDRNYGDCWGEGEDCAVVQNLMYAMRDMHGIPAMALRWTLFWTRLCMRFSLFLGGLLGSIVLGRRVRIELIVRRDAAGMLYARPAKRAPGP